MVRAPSTDAGRPQDRSLFSQLIQGPLTCDDGSCFLRNHNAVSAVREMTTKASMNT